MSSTNLYKDNQTQFESQRRIRLPLATHQGANSARLAKIEASELRGDRTPQKLGEERDDTDEDDVSPSNAIIQQPKIRAETREREVLETK